MTPTRPPASRGLLVTAVLLLHPASAPAQRLMQQDSTLDNLSLPAGYRTGVPGEFGRIEVRGHGPRPLILIPGLGFSGRVFDRFLASGDDAYTMYVVTLAGFGGTSSPPMPPAGTSYADQTWIRGAVAAVRRLVAARHLRRPVLVGFEAVGGLVAVEAALDDPGMPAGVIVISGEPARDLRPGTRVTPERRRTAVDEILAPRWFRTVTQATWDSNMWSPEVYARNPETGRALWQEVARVPIAVMIRYLCEFLATDLTGTLDSFPLPTLVIRPGFSAPFRADTMNVNAIRLFQESWAGVGEGNPRIERITIPDAHAVLMADAPAAVDDAVQAFLRRLGP